MTSELSRSPLKPFSIIETMRSRIKKYALYVLFSPLVMFAPIGASAEGPVAKQPTCTLTWVAPQFNTDGTLLHDLKEYRIYYGATMEALNASTTPFAIKSGVDPNPPGEIWTETWACSSFPLGQGYVTVTAVNMPGNESARAVPFPFVLVVDVIPSPPTQLQVR